MRRTTAAAGCVVLLLATAGHPGAWAWQPTFSAGVDLVTVGVTVTNRTLERHAEDLTAADFQVWEDGQPQAVALLTRERRPVSLCLVLDASGSMAFEFRRQLARAAMDALVEGLEPGDQVAAVVFRDAVDVRLPWTRAADARSIDWHDASTGDTSLFDGVRAGLSLLEQASNPRRAIVVVTDGIENSSRISLGNLATTRQQSEAVVYAFGMTASGTDEFGRLTTRLLDPKLETDRVAQPSAPGPAAQSDTLDRLVGDSGGTLTRISSGTEAVQAARNVVADLKYQYTLGYTPTRPMDGRYRRMKVAVTRPGLHVRHRGGYLAMPRNPAATVTPPTTTVPPAPASTPAPNGRPAAGATDRGAASPPDRLAAEEAYRPAYEAAVRSVRASRGFAEAYALIGAWDRDELSAAVASVSRRSDPDLLDAAALFHLEVAVAGAAGAPDDAWYHVGLGERLLAERVASPDPLAAAFASRWYAAGASVFLAQSDTVRARTVVEHGLERLRDQAHLHFMAGRVDDIEALRFDEDRGASEDERLKLNLERRTRLALAERAYQAALRLDPAHAPARIHVARVLFLLDRNDESRRLLEPLVDAPTLVAPARYLATLFLAAVLERAGDLDGARARLAGVPAFAPGRQTAWLALAELELGAGRLDEARHMVEDHLTTPGPVARDEWWGYRNGVFQVEDLAWLRSRVYR